MTNEQINIAIAKHCGFTDIIWPTGFHQQMSDKKSKEAGGRWRFQIPDYCNDFNAIQEAAETHLTLKQKGEFSHKLNITVWPKNDTPERNKFLGTLTWEQMIFYILNATPRQRAVAFLKAIEKWDETQEGTEQ